MNKLTTKINFLYFSTLMTLIVTLFIAWQMLFIPFIEKSEQTKADLLLSPYAPIFEQLIDDNNFDDLEITISSLMLLKDEDNQQPLILYLNVILSDDKVIAHHNEKRESHFMNKIPIFSPSTFELLGNLEMSYNDYTYNQIVDNSNKAMMLIMAVFILLFLLGQQLLLRIIKPLTTLSQYLSNIDALNIDKFPEQKKGLSTEIKNVWIATKVMLERISKREYELQEKHEIAQQALIEKLAAESANKTKSMFIANMSHEIRTPLTAIIGFADALREDDLQLEEREKATNIIVRNGKHLLSIINDILDLSKIESENLSIEKIEISPLELINDVELLLAPQIKDNGLKFNINHHFPLPRQVLSDPTRIRQILFNLLSNASKFTKKGSIDLDVQYDDFKKLIKISVKDTGIGLTEEQMLKIFNPFSQADVSTTRKFGGTGLGLTISRSLAKMLGGDLKAHSVVGHGSEFVFTFETGPIKEMYTKETQFLSEEISKETEVDISLLKGNILIAEDTKDIQELIAYYLSQVAVDVMFANNGEEAVEMALKYDFDLILMDMQMPVLDGIGATRKLHEMNYEKPIIAVTANVMKEEREHYLAEGMIDFIAKPIDQQHLYEALKKYLPDSYHQETLPDLLKIKDKELKKQKTKERLANGFKDRLPNWLSELSLALENNDAEALARTSHVLKGLGGSFGFQEITDLSSQLETFAKAADFINANNCFKELEKFCQEKVLV